ncbi:MAG: tetratricopeptide repeat protein [Bacteroidales bacterium]|nr:tetratricopeptide repeat protein [Bacteroidales bacterium]
MKKIDDIKQLLFNSEADAVISATDEYIHEPSAEPGVMAEVYCLRGHAFRQKGDWRQAMNAYLASMELDPDGPAAESYRAAQQVLGFYCTDYYNP